MCKDQVHVDARRLEDLLPRVMRVLFLSAEDDPLGDVSMAQIRLLRMLDGHDRVPAEMSHQLGLTPSALTQIANRLEKIGLVERKAQDTDRRVRRIGLSELGRQKMAERRNLRISRAERILVRLSDAHRQALIEALEDLLEAMPEPPPTESIQLVAELEQPVTGLDSQDHR